MVSVVFTYAGSAMNDFMHNGIGGLRAHDCAGLYTTGSGLLPKPLIMPMPGLPFRGARAVRAGPFARPVDIGISSSEK